MKKFKNTFGVTGTAKQLAAFAEAAEGLGWKNLVGNIGCLSYNGELYFCGHSSAITDRHGSFWVCVESGGTYQLPSQWPEALQAASEVEEALFEVGKKYIAEDGEIVLCTERETPGNRFAGVRLNCNVMYANDWLKSYFTPYDKPVTL